MLHPEIPPEGKIREPRPDEGKGEGELSPHIAALAEEEGIVMRRANLTPYTIHAQAVTEYAKRFGKAGEFHHAAYKAFWEDGVNLGVLTC
jgi:predicted DsbA family dithiol-disulfide isomerase